MAKPKFVQTKKTFLETPISDTETGEILLGKLQDLSGNNLSMSDFGDKGYITINPGNDNEEIVSFTDFTTNDDDTASIDTNITRGLESKHPYGAGGTAHSHGAGDVVVVSNNPQKLDEIITYAEGLANDGAADADEDTKGLFEAATVSEINDGDETGGTGAFLAIPPDALESSKYGQRLPSSKQKNFLDGMVGAIIPTMRSTAPTGFLLCQGQSVDNDTHSDLAQVLITDQELNIYGDSGSQDFTADDSTDVITANSHGLSDGDIIFVNSTNTLPSGLSKNTVYYVISSTSNTFKVSTSEGGSAVDITSTGSGTHTFYNQMKLPDLRSSIMLGAGQKVVTLDFTDSDVNTSNEEITVPDNKYLYTGQEITLSNSGGGLPTGLSAQTYYIIRVNSTTVKLATSRSNAVAGTAVDITDDSGGGTHTITLTFSDRTLGDQMGEEGHSLTKDEIPSHYHGVQVQGNDQGHTKRFVSTESNADSSSGAAYDRDLNHSTVGDVPATQPIGSDTQHNNMPPTFVVNHMIKT